MTKTGKEDGLQMKDHREESVRWIEPRPAYVRELEPGIGSYFKSIPPRNEPDPATAAHNAELLERMDQRNRDKRKPATGAAEAEERKRESA
jgi:hypothetical protein